MRAIALSLICALLVSSVSPGLAVAQSWPSQATGYGQPVGQRRQLVRPMTSQSPGSSSFNEAKTGMASGQFNGHETMPGPLLPGGAAQPGGMGLNSDYYQVHVLGQVKSPGTYRVMPSTRLDEALNIAGGIAGLGANRSVQVRRYTETKVYDIFRFKRYGELAHNPFLLDNDAIFVPYATRVAEIEGPVRSPGLYELHSKSNSVWDLVRVAGGFTAGVASHDAIRIIRYQSGAKEIVEVENNEQVLRQTAVIHGDIIVIPHVLTKGLQFDYNVTSLPADNVFYPSFNDNIFVMGAVELPGAYPYSVHYRTRDYVSMAGAGKLSRLNDAYVVTREGKKLRKRGDHALSPGDTIVIPTKHMTADNVLKWYNTVANSIITGFTLRELIRR